MSYTYSSTILESVHINHNKTQKVKITQFYTIIATGWYIFKTKLMLWWPQLRISQAVVSINGKVVDLCNIKEDFTTTFICQRPLHVALKIYHYLFTCTSFVPLYILISIYEDKIHSKMIISIIIVIFPNGTSYEPVEDILTIFTSSFQDTCTDRW